MCTRLSALLIVLLSLALAGCGGTTSPDGGDSSGASTDNDASSPDDSPSTVDTGQNTVQLGWFGDDGQFVAHVIGTSDADAPLTGGQSTTLKVALVNSDNSPLTDASDIAFTSSCLSNGLADIEPANITTAGGRASATYTAKGCDGKDTITATTVVEGTTLQAQVSLQTRKAPPGSITFQAADASVIGVKGAGGTLPEQATLSFKITNTAGGPAPNQPVDFKLNTQVGGIALSNTQGVTDANGVVATTVTSGTIATTVRVTATTTVSAGHTLSTQSNGLSITTGLPDNDSFTIGAQQLNIEGWDYDNTTTKITALLADRFNNPVPDGTAVTFSAEGGSIDGQCLTKNGQCAVTFRSQNPRPADGRVTILATATGEESFTDENGNGLYDSELADHRREPFDDLPEAYRDDNENGVRDSNEPFLDFNNDLSYSPGDGQFTGVRCTDSDCDVHSLNVRGNLVLVLSGSSLNIDIQPNPIVLGNGPTDVTVTVRDARGQVAPAGTTIEAETTQGSIIGPSSFTQPSAKTNPASNSSAGTFMLRLKPGAESGNGSLLITATTPNGDGTISRGRATIDQAPM